MHLERTLLNNLREHQCGKIPNFFNLFLTELIWITIELWSHGMECPILDIDSCPPQWHTTLKSWHFWDQISHKTIYSIKYNNNKYINFLEKHFLHKGKKVEYLIFIFLSDPTDNCFYDLYNIYSATFIEHGWVIFLILRIIRIPSLSSWCCDWWCIRSYMKRLWFT